MSVTVAITVTIPNSTAAAITASGTDFSQTVGPEVARLVVNQVKDKAGPAGSGGLGAVTVATVVT